MREEFEKKRKLVDDVREGQTLPADSFDALLVMPPTKFVYVIGDLKPTHSLTLNRSSLFLDGSLGTNTLISTNLENSSEPLSILGARELTGHPTPHGVSILLFKDCGDSSDAQNETLRHIDHTILLVQTEDPKALFDACMEHIATSAPGTRSKREAAKDLVTRAQETLNDLGYPLQVRFREENTLESKYGHEKIRNASSFPSFPDKPESP